MNLKYFRFRVFKKIIKDKFSEFKLSYKTKWSQIERISQELSKESQKENSQIIDSLSEWLGLNAAKIVPLTILHKLFFSDIIYLKQSSSGRLKTILPLDIVSIIRQKNFVNLIFNNQKLQTKINISEIYEDGRFRDLASVFAHFQNERESQDDIPTINISRNNFHYDSKKDFPNMSFSQTQNEISKKIHNSNKKEESERLEKQKELKKLGLKNIEMSVEKLKMITIEVENFHNLIYTLLKKINEMRNKNQNNLQKDNFTFAKVQSQPSAIHNQKSSFFIYKI